MSTENNNITGSRFAQIATLGENIFSTRDFANLWKITNFNTLYTTLKRYTQSGLIHRIYNGLYSLKPIEKVDPFLLGIKAVDGFAYISTETVLVQAGIITQYIKYITLVSSHSKSFTIVSHQYRSRQLQDKYLFHDIGVSNNAGVRTANVSRAIADLLYFAPNFHFDNQLAIDWKKVREIQIELGYPLTPHYYDDSTK